MHYLLVSGLERALEGGGGADLQQLEHAALVRGETNALNAPGSAFV